MYNSWTYNVPKGNVGKQFIQQLATLIENIVDRKSNFEKVSVFIITILQREEGITLSKDIRRRIGNRLDACNTNKTKELVEDTKSTMASTLHVKHNNITPEKMAKIFKAKVLKGDVRGAIRFLTEREKGGVLALNDTDPKPN